MRYFLDAGVLLRFCIAGDPAHGEVREAVSLLLRSGNELCYTFQSIREFWSVATRAQASRGYGLSPGQANKVLGRALELFVYLSPDERSLAAWFEIVVEHGVSGKNAHDAGHVAAMRTHGITRMVSLDLRDFARYHDILVLTPAKVLSEG